MGYVKKTLKDGDSFAVPVRHIKKVNMTQVYKEKWEVDIEVMDDIYNLYLGDSKEDAQKVYDEVLNLIKSEK